MQRMFWSEGLIRKWNTYICIFLPGFFKWKEKVLDWDILRGARVNKLTVWTIDTRVCVCVIFLYLGDRDIRCSPVSDLTSCLWVSACFSALITTVYSLMMTWNTIAVNFSNRTTKHLPGYLRIWLKKIYCLIYKAVIQNYLHVILKQNI